jgi:hypothetical protein
MVEQKKDRLLTGIRREWGEKEDWSKLGKM